jgi:hypothetical protein
MFPLVPKVASDLKERLSIFEATQSRVGFTSDQRAITERGKQLHGPKVGRPPRLPLIYSKWIPLIFLISITAGRVAFTYIE